MSVLYISLCTAAALTLPGPLQTLAVDDGHNGGQHREPPAEDARPAGLTQANVGVSQPNIPQCWIKIFGGWKRENGLATNNGWIGDLNHGKW